MFSFFKSLFTKTVDSIIADISAKIESLHVVAEAKATAAALHEDEIALRTRLKADAIAEYDRAKRIASKFAEFIN